jgi:hypothetical protein
MSNARPTRDSMSLEEATVSNMWEIAARGWELVHLVYPVFLVCPVCSLRGTNDTTIGPDRRLPQIAWLVHDGNNRGDPALGGRSPACGA